MSGEDLESKKPLITKTSVEYNDADRYCQLWQVTCTFRLLAQSTIYGIPALPVVSPKPLLLKTGFFLTYGAFSHFINLFVFP